MDLPGAQQGYKPGEFVDITWTSVTVEKIYNLFICAIKIFI